jgi:hypothetical protein
LIDQIKDALPSMKSPLLGTIKIFSVKETYFHLDPMEEMYLSPSTVNNCFPRSSEDVSRQLVFLPKFCGVFL